MMENDNVYNSTFGLFHVISRVIRSFSDQPWCNAPRTRAMMSFHLKSWNLPKTWLVSSMVTENGLPCLECHALGKFIVSFLGFSKWQKSLRHCWSGAAGIPTEPPWGRFPKDGTSCNWATPGDWRMFERKIDRTAIVTHSVSIQTWEFPPKTLKYNDSGRPPSLGFGEQKVARSNAQDPRMQLWDFFHERA